MSEMHKGSLDDIRRIAAEAKEQITRITGHWSAGRYEPNNTDLADYHVLVLYDGTFLIRDDFTEVLAHTWHHNTGNIGISMAGCYGATQEDLGEYAPTYAQINAFAAAVKAICDGLDEFVNDIFKTHAEQATIDGYGPGSGDPETRQHGGASFPG